MKRLALFLSLGLWAVPLPAEKTTIDPQLEQRVQVLERRVQAFSELLLQMDRLQREVQQLRGELELQNHAVDSLTQRQRDLYLDIDKRLGEMKVTGTPPDDSLEVGTGTGGSAPAAVSGLAPAPVVAPAATPPVTAAPASAGEERDYQHAFNLLTLRRYDEARQAFKSFLGQYPGGQYADNAQYWLGETGYVTRDFDSAMTDFTHLLKAYPDSPKVAGTMLKIGYIEYEKKQLAQSRETLETLIERFPGSTAARLAQDFIRNKGL